MAQDPLRSLTSLTQELQAKATQPSGQYVEDTLRRLRREPVSTVGMSTDEQVPELPESLQNIIQQPGSLTDYQPRGRKQVRPEDTGTLSDIGTSLQMGYENLKRGFNYLLNDDTAMERNTQRISELSQNLTPEQQESFGYQLAQSAPAMAFMMLAAVPAALGGGVAAGLLAGAARAAPSVARVVAGVGGAASAGVVEGGIAGGMTGGSVQADLLAKEANNEIQNTPLYKELIKQGLSHTEAAEQTITQAAKEAAIASGLSVGAVSAVLGTLGPLSSFRFGQAGARAGSRANLGERAVQPAVSVRQALGQGLAKGAAYEGLEEGVQTGLEQIATQSSLQQNIDPNINPLDDIIKNMAEGAAMGAIVGGPLGAGARVIETRRARKEQEDSRLANLRAEAAKEQEARFQTEQAEQTQAQQEQEQLRTTLPTVQQVKVGLKKVETDKDFKARRKTDANLLEQQYDDTEVTPTQLLSEIRSVVGMKQVVDTTIDENVSPKVLAEAEQRVEKQYGAAFDSLFDTIEQNKKLDDVRKEQLINAARKVVELRIKKEIPKAAEDLTQLETTRVEEEGRRADAIRQRETSLFTDRRLQEAETELDVLGELESTDQRQAMRTRENRIAAGRALDEAETQVGRIARQRTEEEADQTMADQFAEYERRKPIEDAADRTMAEQAAESERLIELGMRDQQNKPLMIGRDELSFVPGLRDKIDNLTLAQRLRLTNMFNKVNEEVVAVKPEEATQVREARSLEIANAAMKMQIKNRLSSVRENLPERIQAKLQEVNRSIENRTKTLEEVEGIKRIGDNQRNIRDINEAYDDFLVGLQTIQRKKQSAAEQAALVEQFAIELEQGRAFSKANRELDAEEARQAVEIAEAEMAEGASLSEAEALARDQDLATEEFNAPIQELGQQRQEMFEGQVGVRQVLASQLSEMQKRSLANQIANNQPNIAADLDTQKDVLTDLITQEVSESTGDPGVVLGRVGKRYITEDTPTPIVETVVRTVLNTESFNDSGNINVKGFINKVNAVAKAHPQDVTLQNLAKEVNEWGIKNGVSEVPAKQRTTETKSTRDKEKPTKQTEPVKKEPGVKYTQGMKAGDIPTVPNVDTNTYQEVGTNLNQVRMNKLVKDGNPVVKAGNKYYVKKKIVESDKQETKPVQRDEPTRKEPGRTVQDKERSTETSSPGGALQTKEQEVVESTVDGEFFTSITVRNPDGTRVRRILDKASGVVTEAKLPTVQVTERKKLTGEAALRIKRQRDTGRKFLLGGVKAETANLDSLDKALQMEGVEDPVTIWEQTGWYREADGKWRFELDDSQATVNKEAVAELVNNPNLLYLPLNKVLQHKQLEQAYPELYNTLVFAINHSLSPGSNHIAEYSPITSSIEVRKDMAENTERLVTILLHEIQHAVQVTEGFSRGVPSKDMGSLDYFVKHMRNLIAIFSDKNSYLPSIYFEKRREDYLKIFKEQQSLIDKLDKARETEDKLRADKIKLLKAIKDQKATKEDYVKGKELEAKAVATTIEVQDTVAKVFAEFSKNGDLFKDFTFLLYNAHLGEIEARNVEYRMVTREETRNIIPTQTAEIPSEYAIQAFYNRAAQIATTDAPNSHTKETLTQEIKSSGFGNLLSTGKVIVLNDLPLDVPMNSAGYVENGTIYLVPRYISKGDAIGTLLHENFHTTLESILGTRVYRNMLNSLKTISKDTKDPEVVAALKKADESVEQHIRNAEQNNTKVGDVETLRLEEFGAHLIMTSPNHTWVQRLINLVTGYLKKLGFMQLNKNDVKAFAISALRNAGPAQRSTKGTGQRKFLVYNPLDSSAKLGNTDKLVSAINKLSTVADVGTRSLAAHAGLQAAEQRRFSIIRDKMSAGLRQVYLSMMMRTDKADALARYAPSIRKFTRHMLELDADRSYFSRLFDEHVLHLIVPYQGNVEAIKIAGNISKVYKKEELKKNQEALSILAMESTLRQIDPRNTTYQGKDGSKVVNGKTKNQWHKELRELHQSLRPEFQQAYNNLVNAYQAQSYILEMSTVINRTGLNPEKYPITSDMLVDSKGNIKELDLDTFYKNVSSDIQGKKDEKVLQKSIKEIRKTYSKQRGITPYLPVRRRGMFYVRAKSKSTGQEYASMVNTPTELEELLKVYQQEPDLVPAVGKSWQESSGRMIKNGREYNETFGVTEGFMKEAMDAVDRYAQGLTGSAKGNLKAEMWKMWLETLPETPVNMARMQRKNIRGADMDVAKNFAEYMANAGRLTSILRWSHLIQQDLDATKKEVNALSNIREQAVQAQFLESLNEDYIRSLNPNTAGISTKITKFGFNWVLGGNISGAAVNLTQVPQFTLPVLATHFGWAKAAKKLVEAYKESFTIIEAEKENLFNDRNFSVARAYEQAGKKLSKDEERLLEDLERYDILNRTTAMNAFEHEGIDSSMLDSKASTSLTRAVWKATVNNWLPAAFHKAERVNRTVTALASYRLLKDDYNNPESRSETAKALKLKNKPTEQAVYDALFDFVININDETQVNMSPSNRAKLLRGNVGRIVGLFKQYVFHVATIMLQNSYRGVFKPSIRETMKLFGKEQQWSSKTVELNVRIAEQLARRKLVNILGTSALLTGVTGLPLYTLVTFTLSSLFDDEDEFFDADLEFKKSVADTISIEGRPVLEDFVETTVRDGLFNALGLGIKDRIMLNDLLFRDPFVDMSTPEGRELYLIEQIAGPLWGIGRQMNQAYEHLQNEQYRRAVEGVVPVFLRNMLKARRLHTEGHVSTNTGYTILDKELFGSADYSDVGEVALRTYRRAALFLGITPSVVTDIYDQRSAYIDGKNFYEKRRASLLQQYWFALQEGDYGRMRELLREIDRFNYLNPELKIGLRTLRRSMEERKRKGREAILGLVLDKNLAPLLNRDVQYING